MKHFYKLSAPEAKDLAPQAILVGNVIVVDEQERILLGRRRLEATYDAGKWNLPGGRCEDGESYERTALRELHEEFGLAVDAGALSVFGGYCCVYDDRIVNAFYYIIRLKSGVCIQVAADEFSDGGFHPLSDVAGWELAFQQQRVIRDYLADRRGGVVHALGAPAHALSGKLVS
jgi:ADP-ribose pyrophosphatase YjhB (NUDIX family)